MRSLERVPYVAALILGAFLSRLSALFVPLFNSDEAYLAMQGRVLAHGGRLYRDIADRKPPLVPLVYSGVFRLVGHDSLFAVHVLAIVVIAMTAYVVGLLAKKLGASERFAATFYLLASVSFLPADTLAANFETFAMLPLCLAVYVADRRPFTAGVLLGIAILCKQTAAVAIVVICVEGIVPVLLGVALPIAVAAGLLGAHELYFWTCGSTKSYLTVGNALTASCVRGILMTSAYALCHAPFVWLAWRAKPSRLLFVWLASSAIAICAGLRFFGHYYEQLLPPLVLLAALGWRELGANRKVQVFATMLALASVGTIAGFFARAIHRMPRYDVIASYVHAHSKERIEVWGHFPELYWAAERSPSSRLVHDGFLTGASGGRPRGAPLDESEAARIIWAQYLDDLDAHPPELFVDTSPSGLRDYDQFPITRFAKLDAWLAHHYRRATVIEGFVIYERR